MDLSRRQFLKTSAVVSGSTGLALNADRKVLRTLEAVAPAQAEGSSEEQIVTVFTPCAGCHQKCVLWVHVVDGRITKTEPAQFPDQPEDNHCCLKGIASARFPYQPDRLKYPVKRVGERGEGKWEQISWDEALDTVAEMLKETRDKYGAKAVFTDHTGSTVSPQNNDVNSGAEAMRFENLFGSTYPDGWYDDTSLLVSNFFTTGQDLDCNDPRGLMHSKLIIICGANPAEASYRDWKHILRAKDAGARVIDIGVLFDPTAAKCDEFIKELCIGCHVCSWVCPYDIPKFGKDGTIEKCNLCVSRIDEGKEPFCVTACVYGARVFGDLNDPESPAAKLLARKRGRQLLPEYGTDPTIRYVG